MKIKYEYFNFVLLPLILFFTYSEDLSETKKVWADPVIVTVDVNDMPANIEYNPSNEDIYIINVGSGDISVIDGDTNAVVTTIDVGDSPRVIEYNPSNGDVYVTNQGSGDVSVIDSDTNSVVTTIDVGQGPVDVLNTIQVMGTYM